MIYLHFNDRDELKILNNPDKYYNHINRLKWLDDPLVQKFAKEVDGATYIGNFININREGLPIQDNYLSIGFKILTLMYKLYKEYLYLTSKLGDKYWVLLEELQDKKDYHMFNNSVIPKLSKRI